MGDPSGLVRSSGLRFLLRLLSVAAALLVLSVSSRAAAAANGAVPMCGEHNESVAAPPIFRLSEGGRLRALPCQPPDVLGVRPHAPAPSSPVVVVVEPPERMLGFTGLFIADGPSSRVSVAVERRALERPGFLGTPFRPPRA